MTASLVTEGWRTEYVTFPDRESRSRYVGSRFSKYLRGSVLDVGCFEAPLRGLLKEVEYVGVDVCGDPDVRVDLETSPPLPFESDRFDCVLCIDVLEHLDNLHAVFVDLIRMSKRHVIVSLPNCWCDARRPIARGKGSFGHYGLPFEKPVDRHKWFFSLTQARDFFTHMAGENGLSVVEMFSTEKSRNGFVTSMRKLVYPGERYRNRYTQTLWVVYLKKSWSGGTSHPD